MMIVEVYYQDLAIVYFANSNPARKPRLLPVVDWLVWSSWRVPFDRVDIDLRGTSA